MAKLTAKKIRDLNPIGRKPYGVYCRFDEFFNLLLNSVKIRKKSSKEALNYAVETFVKRALFQNGNVAYDKLIDKWFYVYGEGLNELGNPTTLTCVTANGKTFIRTASYEVNDDGCYKIDALPMSMTMEAFIRETTDFVTACDIAIRQNLEACKTPYIVVCKNKDLLLSFEQALAQKQEGQAVVVVNEDLGEGMKSINISVDYLADRFTELEDVAIDKLLNKLGIMTANIYKKERVQGAEVNATLGQATDYIYLLIDTFNKQMETYGLDFEMVINGSLEEIYLNDINSENDVVNDDIVDTDIVEKGA